MFLNVLTLGVLTFSMIRTAKDLRGRLSYTDAFFPLAFFHWGGYEHMIWWMAFDLIMPVALLWVLLRTIARNRTHLPPGTALLAGTCLILLPLCGPSGLAFVPGLALWLGDAVVLRWRSAEPHSKRNALLLGGLVLAALLLIPLYFYGSTPNNQFPPSPSPWVWLKTSVCFLSMGFGPAVAPLWQLIGWWVAVLIVASGLMLLVVWFWQPPERFRALGFLAFLVGAVGLALGSGWGRSGLGEAYPLQRSHYVIVTLPTLCCLYFIWLTYYAVLGGRIVQIGFLALVGVLLWKNMQIGLRDAREIRFWREAFEQDLVAGTPPEALAQRYCPSLYLYYDPDAGPDQGLAGYTRMLHRAGIGPFRFMQEGPASFREVPLSPQLVKTNQMTWEGGAGSATGYDPYLVFALEKPQRVYGIRLQCSYEETPAPLLFQLFWRDSSRDDFAGYRCYSLNLKTVPTEKTITVWIYDTIDQFRVDPAIQGPCKFKISKMVLLVPETGAPE
jgi:hypothetical protein